MLHSRQFSAGGIYGSNGASHDMPANSQRSNPSSDVRRIEAAHAYSAASAPQGYRHANYQPPVQSAGGEDSGASQPRSTRYEEHHIRLLEAEYQITKYPSTYVA